MRGTIKMGGHMIWITFVITAQFSAVLGRNSFYEYYYSRYHHKDHSTTAGLSSSTTGISADISDVSSEEKTASSVSDDTSLKNLLRPLAVDLETTVHRNTTLLGYGEHHKFHHIFISRIVLVVGGIIAFLCIIGVIVCCCPKCCRGNEYRGYERRSGVETATEVQAQQPILVPYPQQPVVIYPPHYPEERMQQYLPEYQPQLMPQQYQYGSRQPQFYNLPEAPPPYESPPKC